MNFINLIENIKTGINYNAFSVIYSDFMETYRENYEGIRYCKSTAEKAIKKYIGAAKFKDETKTGTYSNGTTVLLLSQDIPEAEPEKLQKIDLASKIIEMWKNRRPSSCYFIDSIALYKTLKKQDKKTDYFLHIDGHYYNAALVADMIECITTNKELYISAEICENSALLIKQASAALILPVNITACHPSKNINMQDFLKYADQLEKSFLNEAIKTA